MTASSGIHAVALPGMNGAIEEGDEDVTEESLSPPALSHDRDHATRLDATRVRMCLLIIDSIPAYEYRGVPYSLITINSHVVVTRAQIIPSAVARSYHLLAPRSSISFADTREVPCTAAQSLARYDSRWLLPVCTAKAFAMYASLHCTLSKVPVMQACLIGLLIAIRPVTCASRRA